MDIDAYRRRSLAEIRDADPPVPAARAAVTPDAPPGERADAVMTLPLDTEHYEASVAHLLALLGDADGPAKVRLAALVRLKAAAFSVAAFTPFHAAFLQLLRIVALDPEGALRAVALEQLALEKDGYAQQLLRDSLDRKRKSLIPDAKAIQLLGLDDHARSAPTLRRMAEKGRGKIREEALRALASDPRSAPLFHALAADKAQSPAIRQISALGLKNLAPGRFARIARQIVMDEGENDLVKATALSAIANSDRLSAKLGNRTFSRAVDLLGDGSRSRLLKASIRRFRQARERGGR